MSYTLKINRMMRGKFISPCPDCMTPHCEDAKDCDEWCLKNCAHPIDRDILSESQKKIHNQRRMDTIQDAIKMLATLRCSCDISDNEYRKRIDSVIDRLSK